MKKNILFIAVLTVLLTACSSHSEEALIEKSNDYSKMKIAGTLHNQTMTSVYNIIKCHDNLLPADNYEIMLDSFAKIAKYSFDYECDKTTKSSKHSQYKYFLDSESFYNKIVAHSSITRSESDIESVIESVGRAIDSEYINLDSLACIDEMLYAFTVKNIISDKAANIIENIHNLICRSSEGTISDAEFQRQIDKNWSYLNVANFGDDSYEGFCIAAILYVTQASLEWWKENQIDMPQEGRVAQWVALDSAGAIVGGLFHCFRHWDDQLNWGDLAMDCAEGAVFTSLGCVKFKK